MRFTALGPSLAGCHEIPADVAAEFIRLGGDDIQVWDTEYIIDAHETAAVEYAVKSLELTDVTEGIEE